MEINNRDIDKFYLRCKATLETSIIRTLSTQPSNNGYHIEIHDFLLVKCLLREL